MTTLTCVPNWLCMHIPLRVAGQLSFRGDLVVSLSPVYYPSSHFTYKATSRPLLLYLTSTFTTALLGFPLGCLHSSALGTICRMYPHFMTPVGTASLLHVCHGNYLQLRLMTLDLTLLLHCWGSIMQRVFKADGGWTLMFSHPHDSHAQSSALFAKPVY